jgi:hypothetical protein
MVIAFDLFVILAGLILSSNIGNVARKIYLRMRLGWERMGDTRSNRTARSYLIFAVFPFWVFRLIFFLACVVGGSISLATGPR